MQKPPRVFVKAGYFWMELWFPSHKKAIKRSTHIALDITPPESLKNNPTWWKESKRKKQIAEAMEAFEFERSKEKLGIRTQSLYSPIAAISNRPVVNLEKLLESLNVDSLSERGALSASTLRRRTNSLNTINRFDPKVHAGVIDRAWVGRFRVFMTQKEFTDWTQFTILTDLKLILEFATSKGYINTNPFGKRRDGKIELNQPETIVEHTSLEDEFNFFRSLYMLHPHAFLIVITERLTGFRNIDILEMKRESISLPKKTFLRSRNIKAKRDEYFPIPESLFVVYDNMQDQLGLDYAFRHITYAAVRKCIINACNNAGIERLRTHQFKKNYAGDLQANNVTGLQHIFDFLMHHRTRSTAGKHYTGQNIELMRTTLNIAQNEWLKFTKSLFEKHGQKAGDSTDKTRTLN